MNLPLKRAAVVGCALIAVLSLMVSGVRAATAFSYQGSLAIGGTPANGVYDFQFSLYTAPTAGTKVGGTLTKTNVTVVNGVYAVTLDFGSGTFTTPPLYLQIAYRLSGSSTYANLSGRVQTSVAFASIAGTANGIQGRNVATTAPSAGQVLRWNGVAWTPSPPLEVPVASAGASSGVLFRVTNTGTGQAILGDGTSGAGIWGRSASYSGVFGASTSQYGVYGTSTSSFGVYGISGNSDSAGVFGKSSGRGGWFEATNFGDGVFGASTYGYGVRGNGNSNAGVYGTSASYYGIMGYSGKNDFGVAGVLGEGNYSDGVQGKSSRGYGVYGRSTFLTGVYGYSTYGYGGFFSSLAASEKSFVIDHPLDPGGAYLTHSCVESDERKDVYDGTVSLGTNGRAWVQMPEYFEALNGDFRYQLTAIGGPGPNLHISQEIRSGRFQIAGGRPGMKVSWMVTGVRRDAYARAHPLRVEQEKPEREQGRYLNPEAHGMPEDLRIESSGPSRVLYQRGTASR